MQTVQSAWLSLPLQCRTVKICRHCHNCGIRLSANGTNQINSPNHQYNHQQHHCSLVSSKTVLTKELSVRSDRSLSVGCTGPRWGAGGGEGGLG